MPRRSDESSRKKRAGVASRLRGVSDELGVTMPKKLRRNSAGAKPAPRAKPRKIR